MKIHVDRSTCAGHALCNGIDEELFPLDDEGYSADEPRDVAAGDEGRARDGVEACPEQALRLDVDN